MNEDPGEELGQMDHDELLEEVIKLRREAESAMSKLLDVDIHAPIKTVDPEQFDMLWAVLSPVLRFGHPNLAEDGTDAIWCPGQKCWWKAS